MEFRYPTSRQFPFGEVCEQIVRELEKRNWNVPGIAVKFDSFGTGEGKSGHVSEIRGRDFLIRLSDRSAHAIIIPKKELHVYHDESGPTFYLYVGDDYGRDRQQFMDDIKVNSKLNGQPKTYLQYSGGCDCQNTRGASFGAMGFLSAMIDRDTEKLARMTHAHLGSRPPLLVHTNDLNHEYDPEGDEPHLFNTEEVMNEFKRYLEDAVLGIILSHPVAAERTDPFAEPEPIPFPPSVGQMFCFGEYRDEKRITAGKRDPSQLEPSDRYGLIGSGYRLLPLDMRSDESVPKIARDGFLWCGIGNPDAQTAMESLSAAGHIQRFDRFQYVIRITPNRANGIYIADHGEYERRRHEIGESIQGRDTFTNDEVADFFCARARTLIPISEYRGGFKIPVVLINRELSLDEVEVVNTPRTDRCKTIHFFHRFSSTKMLKYGYN